MSSPRRFGVNPSHADAVDALVAETHRPAEEVARIYAGELARLRVGARIDDYLVLLTSRYAREALRRSDGPRWLKLVGAEAPHLGRRTAPAPAPSET